MNNMNIVELKAVNVRFFSTYDEEAFFEWLDKLHCVVKTEGRGDTLCISINKIVVNEDALRELLGLFHRYCIDLKQLHIFDSDEFAEWLRDPKSYWFSAVF